MRCVCFSEAGFYQGVMARNAELARGWIGDARRVKGTASEKGWESGLLAAIAYLDRWPGRRSRLRREDCCRYFITSIVRYEG